MPGMMKTLRRSSLAEVFRRGSKSDDTAIHVECLPLAAALEKDMKTDAKSATFYTLPTEILAQITASLSFVDLCNARLASRQLKQIVSEGDVLRGWLLKNLDRQLLQLYGLPDCATFTNVASHERRLTRASNAAVLYAHYIEREIVWHSLVRRHAYLREPILHELFQDVASNIRRRLMPLLLTIQHYLESCASLWKRAMPPPLVEDIERHERSIDKTHRDLVEKVDPTHLLEVYRFWLFMIWTQMSLLNRPSYIGTLERAVRGLSSNGITAADMEMVIVVGGLRATSQLIRLRSLKDRRALIETWLKAGKGGSTPCAEGEWPMPWRTFILEFRDTITSTQALYMSSGSTRGGIDSTGYFVKHARDILIVHGLLDASEETAEIGSVGQCREFLEHITGYDVLTRLPDRVLRPV